MSSISTPNIHKVEVYSIINIEKLTDSKKIPNMHILTFTGNAFAPALGFG